MERIILAVLGMLITGVLTGCAAAIPRDTSVVYSVTGAGTATISYTTVQNGDVGSESATAADLPFSKALTVTDGGLVSYTAMTLVAVGNENTTTITCTIAQDDIVISEQTSTGAFAAVSCSTTNRF